MSSWNRCRPLRAASKLFREITDPRMFGMLDLSTVDDLAVLERTANEILPSGMLCGNLADPSLILWTVGQHVDMAMLMFPDVRDRASVRAFASCYASIMKLTTNISSLFIGFNDLATVPSAAPRLYFEDCGPLLYEVVEAILEVRRSDHLSLSS
jgi:hypothetical protein